MIYIVTAFFNGLLNSVNRLTNVKAGKIFGTGNGALINYIEATILSLTLIFLTGNRTELLWGHVRSVPVWVYLGSICGLIAQLLQIVGTLRTNAMVSSILMLVGNLGAAVVLDYFLLDIFSWWKVAGISLILLGVTWIERGKTQKKTEDG